MQGMNFYGDLPTFFALMCQSWLKASWHKTFMTKQPKATVDVPKLQAQ